MIDVVGHIVARGNALGGGITFWRNRLPARFENTAPIVVVSADIDAIHCSGADHDVMVSFRIYGGTAKLGDCASVYGDVCNLWNGYNDEVIATIGELRGQELPPDPVTGWPSYLLRARCRVKER